MLIDPMNCNEKDLAIFCFENITKGKNNPDSDRKASNYAIDYLISSIKE